MFMYLIHVVFCTKGYTYSQLILNIVNIQCWIYTQYGFHIATTITILDIPCPVF
jgi:hypothetical protein